MHSITSATKRKKTMQIELTLISVEHRLKAWLGIQTIAEVYDDDSRIGDAIALLWPN
jgi:hypothetical protein